MKRTTACALVVVVGLAFVPAPVTAQVTKGGWQSTAVPVEKGDITAVAALDERQAWAVGYRTKSLTEVEALALRWDGTSWAQESVLPPGSFPQALEVRSANDIWAAGAGVAHWDGTAWAPAQLQQDPNGRFVPEALDSTPDGQVWAVGRAVPGSVKNGVPTIHVWDGTSWHRQVLPDVGKGEIDSVVALAPNDVWAAGAAFATGDHAPQTTLLLHWDGVSWQRVASPNAAAGHTWIGGLTAVAGNDVWAVGASTNGGPDRPFALHWDGRAWQVTATPYIADGRLRAVGRTGDGELWAVGGKGAVSVALRWNKAVKRWFPAADPGVVVRGFATVPGSSTLWTVGIAKKGDLVPSITRFQR